ncbi:hypothetical protein [Raoultella planticola]|uniref:hypothetical protein n=1 Tax=Raoultella planticola TaxID=575 RepID=UPI000FD99349|nr:hypothetical protein [Raoultella planticola]
MVFAISEPGSAHPPHVLLSVSGRAATITPAGISSKHSPPLQWYYYLIANNKLQCGRKLLPRFVKKNDRTVNRDDDYAVYFSDAGRQHYWFDGFKGHDVHVESLAVSVSDNMQTGKFLVSRRLGMESQTVHYKIWQDHIRIDFFNAINDSLHIIDGNTLPLKGNCSYFPIPGA